MLNGWNKLKNAKTAIKAFNLLRRKLPQAEMFMHGRDFEEGGTASQWATSKGLVENIHFRGYIKNNELLLIPG